MPSIDAPIRDVIATIVVIILAGVLVAEVRSRLRSHRLAKMTAAIIDYFRRSETQVQVACVTRPGNRVIAMIDSEPLKRFRYSHVVEAGLRIHLERECGMDLAKVYWRFPVRMTKEAPAADAAAEGKDEPAQEGEGDDYVSDGQVRIKAEAEYEVTDIPWEQFEKTLHD